MKRDRPKPAVPPLSKLQSAYTDRHLISCDSESGQAVGYRSPLAKRFESCPKIAPSSLLSYFFKFLPLDTNLGRLFVGKLAITGGEPLRKTPFTRWPFGTEAEAQALQD